MAAKNKKGANKLAASKSDSSAELDNMKFWRELALKVCPELKDDENKVGELAIMLHQVCKAMNVEFETISKLCDKNTDNKVSFALAITIDRRVTPSEVKTKLGYSEKHALTFTAQVPDPNVMELPLMDGTKASAEGDGAASAEPAD